MPRVLYHRGMRRCSALIVLSVLALPAQVTNISASRIGTHVRFLSSDLLEGRGVGVRGGDLATEYLAAQFALAGLKPFGDQGTFFQAVPLVGVTTDASAARLEVIRGGDRVSLRWQEDFIGTGQRQQTDESFEAEAIFVGHGITAPEYDWDDYRGLDVRGKVVVLFTNEPESADPKFFGGRALTYYGRWTYKFEQAARQGAIACLIIHTTPTAGYGWSVVRGMSKEDPQVQRTGPGGLAMAGWVTKAAAERLLAATGKTVDQLVTAAGQRGFQPFPLPVRIGGKLPSRIRPVSTRNVIGMVEGSDPKLKSEAVLFTAHWDHLGVGIAVNGDPIYNGAVDNATGCAILLEIAQAWAQLPQKPRRSAIFLSVTAEESGLRGSEYYGTHPAIPIGRHAVNLNFDGYYPFGRTKDVVLTGADRTTLWPIVREVARRFQLEITPESRPEQGFYYRSDHFSLARVGVPAFSISMGTQLRSGADGDEYFLKYNAQSYHQPSDEIRADWDFSGMEEIARFGMVLGLEAANVDRLPTWLDGDEFLPARMASGVQ